VKVIERRKLRERKRERREKKREYKGGEGVQGDAVLRVRCGGRRRERSVT